MQILWINFLIDLPLGIALGFDAETPGLMKRPPRPRSQSILTRPVLLSSVLAGTYMGLTTLFMIWYGIHHAGGAAVGVTMALTAFGWSRVICTFESRSLTATAITVSSFDCKQINRIALGELVLVFLVAHWDALNDLLGTTGTTLDQSLIAIASALVLLVLWEAGKAIARLTQRGRTAAAPAVAAAPSRPGTSAA